MLPRSNRPGRTRARSLKLKAEPGLPWATPASRAWWDHHWLSASGSLTQRLRQLGEVKVCIQSQKSRRLWPSEQQALGVRSGHVREVILCVNGLAVVWARSATTHRGLKGAWRSLKGLGNRALAELLFSHQQVRRGPLKRHPWRAHGPEMSRAWRQWKQDARQGLQQGTVPTAAPRPARASVFWHKGEPLRVMEAFSGHLLRVPRPD